MEFILNGGAREVGKSCIQLKADGLSILFDAGLKLDEPPSYPINPGKIDGLFLSHAHLDHCGGIPAFSARQDFPIYLTEPTAELAHMLQYDSLKISLLKGDPVSYRERDIRQLGKSEIPVRYDQEMKFKGKFDFQFYDAGHIPGSSGIKIEAEGKKIFYTGDTTKTQTRLLNPAQYPDDIDVLVMESTYGNRLHPPREEVEKNFLDEVTQTLQRGGHALIPAFAVGRSQELLMLLDDIPNQVYLDGMAKKASSKILKYPEFLRDSDEFMKALDATRLVEGRKHRREILMGEPAIIVTTAGMLSGGPVLDYLSLMHKDSNSSIILTGYQVEDTNGRLLIDEGYIIDEESGRKFNIQMDVSQHDFSAHSDKNQLLELVDNLNPEEIILVHGDEDGITSLEQAIREKGFSVYAPELGENIVF